MRFVPSVANFFLVFTPQKGEEVYQALLRLGVIVRPMEAYGFDHAIRVSVGLRTENERFLDALDHTAVGASGRARKSYRVS